MSIDWDRIFERLKKDNGFERLLMEFLGVHHPSSVCSSIPHQYVIEPRDVVSEYLRGRFDHVGLRFDASQKVDVIARLAPYLSVLHGLDTLYLASAEVGAEGLNIPVGADTHGYICLPKVAPASETKALSFSDLKALAVSSPAFRSVDGNLPFFTEVIELQQTVLSPIDCDQLLIVYRTKPVAFESHRRDFLDVYSDDLAKRGYRIATFMETYLIMTFLLQVCNIVPWAGVILTSGRWEIESPDITAAGSPFGVRAKQENTDEYCMAIISELDGFYEALIPRRFLNGGIVRIPKPNGDPIIRQNLRMAWNAIQTKQFTAILIPVEPDG